MAQHSHCLDISLKDKKSGIRTYLYTNVCCSLVHNNQKWETTQMSIRWWMDMQTMLYPYSRTLCNPKNDRTSDIQILSANPETIMTSERRKTQKTIYSVVLFIWIQEKTKFIWSKPDQWLSGWGEESACRGVHGDILQWWKCSRFWWWWWL